MFKFKIAAIVTALALMLVFVPGSNILAEEDQHLYFSDGLTLAQFEALHPMAEEDQAKINYDYIKCPVIVDGVYYEAERMSYFNGQILHFTLSKDKVLYAFKSADDLDKYTFEEYGDTIGTKNYNTERDDLDYDFNYYYVDWFWGGDCIAIEHGVEVDDLSDHGMNDCLSSAHTFWESQLWVNADFTGSSLRLPADYYWFELTGFTDMISSIRVYEYY